MKCSLEVVSLDSAPIRESAWRFPRVPSLPRQKEADCDHEDKKREGGQVCGACSGRTLLVSGRTKVRHQEKSRSHFSVRVFPLIYPAKLGAHCHSTSAGQIPDL